MNINERILNDVTIMDLDGDLAMEGNTQFRSRANTAIDAGARKLLVNMAKVPYMDSSGLGEIISCYMRLQKVNGRLKLLNLNNRLQHLLVITKLVTIFETYDSEPDAVVSFDHPSQPVTQLAEK
jgi:anti-sigma B factor antagonist